MLKKFYHKPTKTILTQQDWANSIEEGDFSLITSHNLANMGDDPYSINIIANLEDCVEVDLLKEIYNNFHTTLSPKVLELCLQDKFQLDLETTKHILNHI